MGTSAGYWILIFWVAAPGESIARIDIFLQLSDMKPWVPENGVEFHWGDVFVCEPDWHWGVRNLPDLDLWYVTEGSGWISDGKRRTLVGAGDCLLLRTGGYYDSGHDPARPLTLIAIHFDLIGEGGEPLRLHDGDLPPLLRRMGAGGFFRELLMRALRCHQDGRRAEAGAWLQAALMEVVREDAHSWPAGRTGLHAQSIQEICERVRRHPGRPVRVESLAAELHVSPEHFCRVFRQLQGMSPRAFIARTRMEGAQALLWTSSHSVARIAELLGYQSPSYFSRQFKSVIGLSPSAFRRGDRKANSTTGRGTSPRP
ncbi:MAG: hypothetical protein A3G24_00865 [Betaproteobacteria bacterium RIFCSPLOWO2_12_FULL_62_13]|nr:MAG: hypothetical protein A3G24_00865 [Betaproteobacteria bacterium RIFCSPLOWO2_12_FULL_62_13]